MADFITKVRHEHTSSNEEIQMVSRNSIIEAQHEHTSSNDEIQMFSSNSSPTHLVAQSQQSRISYTYSPQAYDTNQEQPTEEIVVAIDEDGIETTNEISCGFIHAVLEGDKEKAVKIFERSRQEVILTSIGRNGETAFHMAVLAAREEEVANVVKTILNLITETESELLTYATLHGTNALHYAAASGNLKIARIIYEKNPKLANTKNNLDFKPIILAAIAGHSDVIKFLLTNTIFVENDHHGSSVLKLCIKACLFDIAVDMVQNHCPFAAIGEGGDENDETPLEVLAGMPSPVDKKHCSSVKKLLNEIWPILKKSKLHRTPYLEKLLLIAANKGNYELIVYLLGYYPGLIYTIDNSNHTIFHIAIVHRHEKIFTLIHEFGSLKDFIATYQDVENNSMLHLAAELSPPFQLNRIHGATLQMQRELLWYKEVEKIVPAGYVEKENSDGKTPHDIFIEKHLKLMESAEKWIKRTTKFSMVVATLIVTLVFTIAVTIPGGIINSGAPNIRRTTCFGMFVISEILAIIFSSISLTMCLCTLTSGYTEKDFLTYLPLWLTIGTTSLVISLTSMLVAFCNAFLVFKRHDNHYFPILISILALALPMFIGVNFNLLVDIIKTTTRSKSLSRSSKKLFPSSQETML